MHQNIKIFFILAFSIVFLASGINTCNYCNKLISDEWINFEEKDYHTSCYKNQIAPKCSLCLEIITEEYLVDAWGNPFHKSHESQGTYCSSCSRIISEGVTQGGYRLDDGRYLCSLCESNIIISPSQIDTSKRKVLILLEEIGIKEIEENVSISLVNRFVLQNLANEIASSNLKGFTTFLNIKSPYENSSPEYKIYILDRLPAIEFEAVLAHEYLHVWLYQNNIELPLSQIEGFCNLASAYIYEQNGSKFSQIHLNSMNTDTDPNYGDGYRKMKHDLEKYGWKVLLQTLQQ